MIEDLPVPHYLSQSDVARAAGVTRSAAGCALADGVLRPDATFGRGAGFKASNPTVIAYINRDRRTSSKKVQPVPVYLSQTDIARELRTLSGTINNAITRRVLTPDAYVGSTAVFTRENKSVAAYKATFRPRSRKETTMTEPTGTRDQQDGDLV